AAPPVPLERLIAYLHPSCYHTFTDIRPTGVRESTILAQVLYRMVGDAPFLFPRLGRRVEHVELNQVCPCIELAVLPFVIQVAPVYLAHVRSTLLVPAIGARSCAACHSRVEVG